MRTFFAWHKVTHNKQRTAASLGGVSFAIVLVFMQLGFFDTCFVSSTMVLEQLDYDIALVSRLYKGLRVPGSISHRRLAQARSVSGVAQTAPLYVGNSVWRGPKQRFQREMLVLAVDPNAHSFKDPDLQRHVPKLKIPDTGIWDRKAQKVYDRLEPGMTGELQKHYIKIIATYEHGAGFAAPALLILGDQTFGRAFHGYSLDNISIGLVKISPGTDREAVLQQLRAVIPDDTRVLRRADLEATDQYYFMIIKPLGIMFISGVILALIVGAVILYQILASEVMNNHKDYATLRAIGYSQRFVNWLVMQQAGLFAIVGFIPAVLVAVALFAFVRAFTGLPMYLTPDRVVLVFVLSMTISLLSGLLAVRKVTQADPVELF